MLAALTKVQWVIVGLAVAIGLAGLALMAVNVLAIIRPRPAGEQGPSQPLFGPPQQLTRRRFFGRLMNAGFGLSFTTGIGLSSLAFLWPSVSGGFGGRIRLPIDANEIKAQIRATKLPFYYAPGRFYLVEYDSSDDTSGLYTENSLVAGGLMALYQRCVHLGCRVPFCETSQWFECPCHGSKYNRAGEYRAGPAPRSLDRFPLEADADGFITVDTGIIETGPPRGTNTTGQDPEGAFCVDPNAATEAEEEH
jgi:cytochrome b6-f complex iron-sulfur subunit